jgi:hypothetical protein
MITGTVLALLPVVIVVGMAARDLRLWWRELRNIRALDLAAATEDLARARTAREPAWLRSKPVRQPA